MHYISSEPSGHRTSVRSCRDASNQTEVDNNRDRHLLLDSRVGKSKGQGCSRAPVCNHELHATKSKLSLVLLCIGEWQDRSIL